MRITDLRPSHAARIRQAAALLVDGFREHWPNAWPTMDSALAEVRESFQDGRISRIALDEDGTVIGWIGAIETYDGHVWELHPIVVRPDRQRRGIGRVLVADLEKRVRDRGGLTLWVGSDDEDGMTSLAGVDLYPDPLVHLARIRNLRSHPYEFYVRLGFSLAGVLPDANGFGKPDIYLAKRVAGRPQTSPSGGTGLVRTALKTWPVAVGGGSGRSTPLQGPVPRRGTPVWVPGCFYYHARRGVERMGDCHENGPSSGVPVSP